MKFRNHYLKVLLVYVFLSILLSIVLDWSWAFVIIITSYLLTYDHNFKTTKEDSIVRNAKKSYIVKKKSSHLQLNGSLASISAKLHMKMKSNENLAGKKKVEDGTERASLSSLIHRGSTGRMSSLRNTNQPLLSVLKNNTYLREANSYHQSPLKSSLHQSPAKLHNIYNSSLTPRNSIKPPLINNQFTSPSVQMHFSEHSPYINVTRHAKNVNNDLQIYGAYFLNKSLLHTENTENMYSLVNKNFSSPVSARRVGNELYQTTCHDERQESDFSKVIDKTSTEAVVTVLKANSKRKKEANDLSQSPSMDQPSRSKRTKFDSSDLDSTLNELFPPMLSSGSPLRKRLSNIRSSSNRLVSTATQCENLHEELNLTNSLKSSSEMNISHTKLGLTEEQTDQLMGDSTQIHPVEKRNNHNPNVVDETVKCVKEKLNTNDHAEKKVKFNDTSAINLFNESNSNCTTEINSKCSALKDLKSPYRRIFSSLSSPSPLGSTEKLREHPVYFTAHIDIDEIQNNREEFGSKGVSINAFRNHQEYAAKLVNVLLEEADDFSKQKNLVNLKEQFSTSVEIKPSFLSTPSLPVAATCSLVEPTNKTNNSLYTSLSPTLLKTETLKSNQPFTFNIQGAPLLSTSVSSSEVNLKPSESKSVFSFEPTSSVMLPSSNIAAPAVQVTNSFSTDLKSQSATSLSSVNFNTSTLTLLPPVAVSTSFCQISFNPASTSFGGFSFDTKTSGNQLKTSTAVSHSIPGLSFSVSTSTTNITPASIFSINSCMTTSIGSNSSVQMNSLSFANCIQPKNATTATTANFGLSYTVSSSSVSAPFTSNLFGRFGEKSTGSLLFGNSTVCNSVSVTTQSSIFFGNSATSKSDEFKSAISESRSMTFDKSTFSFVTSSTPLSVFSFTTTSSVAQSSNFFGSAPSVFASSTTNLNTVGSLFGSTTVPTLGFPSTSSNVTQSNFGNASSATTLFGAPVSTSAAFNASAHSNIFGSATTLTSTSGFNQPTQISSTGFNFGSTIVTTSSGFSFVPATQSLGFGTTNIFGNQTTVSASIFGAPPISSSTSFGGSTGNSGPYPFGQPLSQSSVSNIFGQPTQQFSTSTMFGPSSQQTIGFNFSSGSAKPILPNFGATSAQPSNLFGVQSAPVKPAFNFNTPLATPSFNFSTNETNAVGFSAAQTPSFGALGGFASPGHLDLNFNSSIPGGGFSIGAATPIPGRQTSKARRRLKKPT